MKLTLDPRKVAAQRRISTPSPAVPPGGSPLTPTLSSPQLSGIWAGRSHVIRPPLPPPSDPLRRPLLSPSPPPPPPLGGDSEERNEHSSPAITNLTPHPQGVLPLKGAWSKPGSGAAVVRSSSGPPPAAAKPQGVPPVETVQQLRHSARSPVATRGGSLRRHNEREHAQRTQQQQQRPRESSRDPRQPGGPREPGGPRDPLESRPARDRQWRRTNSDRYRGDRSNLSARPQGQGSISEQEEEGLGAGPGGGWYQRSLSTTQAHQNRKPHPTAKKPYSEPH